MNACPAMTTCAVRTRDALITFLDTLGPAGRDRIRAISMDMTRIYREAARVHSLERTASCFSHRIFIVLGYYGEVRVLVVDDEVAVRDALCRMLRFEGYEVCIAGEGAAALREVRDR